jgi:hypothetical protein
MIIDSFEIIPFFFGQFQFFFTTQEKYLFLGYEKRVGSKSKVRNGAFDVFG